MIVTKAIFAVDDNIEYKGFWEVNSEICKKNLGITPVLFLITDEDSDFFEDEYGLVKKIKKLPNINSGFQAQIYRLYATKYFIDDVCIIHDIDLFFIDKTYLSNKVKYYSDEDLVILCSDAYDSKRPECTGPYAGDGFRYPLHGIIGKGGTISKIISNHNDFEVFVHNALSLGYYYFDTDEIYFSDCLKKTIDVKIHLLNRGYSSNFFCTNRIEKHHFNNENKNFEINLNGYINYENFIDCHCAKPFSKYSHLIYKIKNEIIR